jgi:uncharacterized protein (TIGR00290 family)
MDRNVLCSWSGGKDSCFALIMAIEEGYQPRALLNVLNEEGKISRSHGIPANILQQQAAAARIPIHLISSSWADYEQHFTNALMEISKEHDISHAVFGDIDLQAHRDWEEKVCRAAGIEAVLPLWQQDRKELVTQMLEAGIRTMIVSCNNTMGEKFIGRIITETLVEELETIGVDPCGENGEYHTLVLDCPIFNEAIQVDVRRVLSHNDYWFADLALK